MFPPPITVVETATFKNDADSLLDEEERLELITSLARNPEAGKVMPGTGGVRKLRFARAHEGKSGGYYVFVVPIEKEVDRKAAAKSVGEKTVDMIHVKDLTKITGYIRGGCSPLGMKKNYPVVFDQSAENFDEIYVSGGRVGLTLKVPLKDLLDVTQGKLAPITME